MSTSESKKARRIAARAAAARSRMIDARRRRRRVWFSLAAGVVAIALLGTTAAIAAASSAHPAAVPRVTAPSGMEDGGFRLPAAGTPTPQASGSPVPTVDVYVDYQCPICAEFEAADGSLLDGLAESGRARVDVHPVAILDSARNRRYSTRSAAAAICVAQSEPSRFFAVSQALFARQPDEATGTGLDESTILSVLRGAGAATPAVSQCVRAQRWAAYVTSRTSHDVAGPLPHSDVAHLQGTPTILIDGRRYLGGLEPAQLAAAIKAAR